MTPETFAAIQPVQQPAPVIGVSIPGVTPLLPVPAIVVPPGTPPTDPAAPKVAVTQTQIDFWVGLAATFLPTLKSHWPWIATALAIFSAIGISVGRYVVPVPTAPIVAPEKPPVIVNVLPPAPVDPIVQPPIVPPIIVPGKGKVTIYRTFTSPALIGLPTSVTIDPVTYATDSTYKFGGKSIPLPCMVFTGPTGVVLDVQTFTTAADVVAFVAKHGVK